MKLKMSVVAIAILATLTTTASAIDNAPNDGNQNTIYGDGNIIQNGAMYTVTNGLWNTINSNNEYVFGSQNAGYGYTDYLYGGVVDGSNSILFAGVGSNDAMGMTNPQQLSRDNTFDIGDRYLTGLKDPVNANDAATKNYVDTSLAGLSGGSSGVVIDSATNSMSFGNITATGGDVNFAAATNGGGNFNFGGRTLINYTIAAPTQAGDIATKGYVDTLIATTNAQVATNTANIASNTSAISAANAQITQHTTNIATNTANITTANNIANSALSTANSAQTTANNVQSTVTGLATQVATNTANIEQLSAISTGGVGLNNGGSTVPVTSSALVETTNSVSLTKVSSVTGNVHGVTIGDT